MKKLVIIISVLLFVFNLSFAAADVVLDGLVARWELEDNTLDSSGNGHDGTGINSPSYTVGVLGRCISLSGYNYVNCGGGKLEGGADTWADITGPMSMCLWYKQPDLSYMSLAAFLTKGNIGGYRIEQEGGWEGRLSRGTYYLEGGRVKAEGDDVVVDGTWHHIAAIYDGSYVKLYVDGVLDAQTAGSGAIATNNWDVAIGQNLEVLAGGTSRNIKGYIDDVRIYDRVLSQGEVQEIVGDIYRKVLDPSPDDGAEAIGTSVVLEWEKGGAFSKSYDIYLGTDFNDVNDASRGDTLGAELMNTGAIVYDVNGLEYGQTYYWRVDGVAENEYACKGDIWEFSTTGNSLAGWWKFDGDMVDSSGNGRDGSLKLTGGSGTYSYVDGPFGGQAFESVNGAFVGIDGSGDAGWAQFRYGSMTIAMWMKSTDPYYHTTLIGKGHDAYKLRQSGTTSLGLLKAYAYGP
ncbi:MAG: LamG domain-containing protein, partial [Planctomycetes bacterium]|nr:LamG domain-containing protein [Planctomycetota bacterium]